MKVRELITELSKCDPESEACVRVRVRPLGGGVFAETHFKPTKSCFEAAGMTVIDGKESEAPNG